MGERAKDIVCGNCVKFHSMACPVESVDSVLYKVYFADPDSTPFRGDCFESKYKLNKMAKCPHCNKYYRVEDKVEKTINGKTSLACPYCYNIIEREKEIETTGWSIKRCPNCGAEYLPKEATIIVDDRPIKQCPHCGERLQ
jgi:transcription elongation factor Elf1